MSLTKVLVFLDSPRRDGCDFLEDLVKSLQTNEELKKLVTALSGWISAFEDRVWELALSEELAEEEVALHVNLALTATRPVIGNYFNGVLEGLVGTLGIKVHEDEDLPCSTQEGLERHLAEELHLHQLLSSRAVSPMDCMLETVWNMQTVRKGPLCQPSHPQPSLTSWMQLITSSKVCQLHRMRLSLQRSNKISWSCLQ